MELQLRHRPYADSDIFGAYLEGSVEEWFAEISFWSIDALSLQVYLVPQSITHNNCKGIFVVFRGNVPKRNLIRYPYTAASEGFFIPADAGLFPNIDKEELNTIKLWDIQFFHPSIGLVGFEHQDAKELSDLIELPVEQERKWLIDWPIVPSMPCLQTIMLEQTGGFDAIDHLKSLVDTKPLSEIPAADGKKNERLETLRKVFRPLINAGLWILLILAFIGKIIIQIISFFVPRITPTIRSMVRPGILQRLDSWMNKQMDFLQKQRDSELNRLVKLFEKDKDMALQYAIPLNSAYLDRGKAFSSGKLTRRYLNFNFNNFGSSGATDLWNLGNYQGILRDRYEKTAADAIADGDYKKAAYVYAHLLGDLFRAAQTLQDGKHYREAAAIYKDHLKNELRAAECLERGGLLNEAIELYVKLEHYEKVGGLYLQLGQEDKAAKYFEEVISRSLNARDYLKAAKVIEARFGDLERCQEVLLEGWKGNNKAEQCLSRYFEIAGMRELSLVHAVKEFYGTHVSRSRGTSFLYVLADLTAGTEDNEFKEAALTICYQIVHQQTSYGDFSAMKTLARFMPNDRLIDQDVHRYTIKHHKQVRHQAADYHIDLDSEVVWKHFCSFHDQLLGIGLKGKEILLLRMNWDEKIEYTYLADAVGSIEPIIIADPGISDEVLVISPEISNKKEQLQASSFFQRTVMLRQLNWIAPNAVGTAIDSNGCLSVLQVQNEDLNLDTYDLYGKRLSSVVCTVNGYAALASELLPVYSILYWRKEHLYFTGRNALMRIDANGVLETLAMESDVLSFSVSVAHAALKIALLTLEGCVVVIPTLHEMEISITLFGSDLSAGLVQLLPNGYLVLATAQKAQVYEFDSKKAKLLFEVFTDHDIKQILSVPKRNHFALVGTDNKVSIFVIPTSLD